MQTILEQAAIRRRARAEVAAAPISSKADMLKPGDVPMVEPFGWCPNCLAHALVELPAAIAAKQSDGTTIICDPRLGGCNVGFRRDGAK